jgi:hypothetical protein
LAHEGKTLPAISAQLGHSSTAVTDRYLRKIAPTELAAAVRDRGRLAKKRCPERHPPPALGRERSGGNRARRGGGRVYPQRLIPVPRRACCATGGGPARDPTRSGGASRTSRPSGLSDGRWSAGLPVAPPPS